MAHDATVRVTVTDVGAAVPLAQPMAERIGSRRVTTLQFMQSEPSALGRLSAMSDALKGEAYAAWTEREAEWRRRGGST